MAKTSKTKLLFDVDEQYPAFFVKTREEAMELESELNRFDEKAIEVTDEELQLIQDYWDISEQYRALCRRKLGMPEPKPRKAG